MASNLDSQLNKLETLLTTYLTYLPKNIEQHKIFYFSDISLLGAEKLELAQLKKSIVADIQTMASS